MSDYQQPAGYDESGFESPSRNGLSPMGRTIVVLAIIFGVVVVLCCGGLTATFVGTAWYAQKSTTQDPEEVRRIARDICPVVVPEPLQPRAGMESDVPFREGVGMKMALFTSAQGPSRVELNEINLGQEEQRQEQAFDDVWTEPPMVQEPVLPGRLDRETTTRTVVLRGREVPMQVTRARDGQSTISIDATVEAKLGGTVVSIQIHLNRSDFPNIEATFEEMVNSIE